MKLKIVSAILLIALAFFGIFFLGLLLHEFIHVKQSKAPVSYCYDIQQATFMHVSHNITSQQEFNKFKAYTEKWAHIGEFISYWILSYLLGVLSVIAFIWAAGKQ